MPTKAHLLAVCPRMSKTGRDIVACHAFSYPFSTAIQQDGALLAAIWGWRSQTARHGCQTPLLHVGLNKNETHLTEIDVHLARPVSANSGEEILRFKTMCYVVQFFSIAREEDGACSGPISDADDITLYVCRTVCCGRERLIVSTGAMRCVRYRGLVESCSLLALLKCQG